MYTIITYLLPPFPFWGCSSASSSCLVFLEPSFSREDIAHFRVRALGGHFGGQSRGSLVRHGQTGLWHLFWGLWLADGVKYKYDVWLEVGDGGGKWESNTVMNGHISKRKHTSEDRYTYHKPRQCQSIVWAVQTLQWRDWWWKLREKLLQ